MTDREARYLVTHDDGATTLLKQVTTDHVHTVTDAPDLQVNDVIDAALRAEPPLEVTDTIVEITDRWHLTVEHSTEAPTSQTQSIAADQAPGEITTQPREGEGELHVLRVPESETDATADEIESDEATRLRAARLGVTRVEIRTAPGLVSIRYLP